MNILIYFCILILLTIMIYIMNKLLDKQGLILNLITSNILSFILSFKFIKFSNISLISNSITYISIFTIIYLLLEKNNKKEIRKLINTNFIINVFIAIILYLMSYYTQALTDTVGINMTNVFIKNYRVLIAYPIVTTLSSHLIVYMYNKIKNLYDNMFISTTTTYLAIGLIDIVLYILLAYFRVYSNKVLIELALSTYMVRLILTVIYSIFLTIVTTKKKVKKWLIHIY